MLKFSRATLVVAGAVMIAAVAGGVAFSRLPNRSALSVTPGKQAGALAFPKGFIWGVAVAGQQVESQQPSDWSAFEQNVVRNKRFEADLALGTTKPGHIRNLGNWSDTVRQEKTGFDTLYPQDIAAAADMGLSGFRTSIEWARLFPHPGMIKPDLTGVNYYKRLIAELKQHHITPFITLFHYVAPAWFFEADGNGRKGWERQDAQQQWQYFVDAVADNFIPDVEQWCTLNEPMVYLQSGYIEGSYPPLEKRKDFAAAADVFEGLLKAHAYAYKRLHQVAAERHAQANVGITQNLAAFEPLRNWAPLDRITAGMVEQAWNWDFLDAIESGELKLANTDVDRKIDGLKGTEDYVGVNYYQRIYAGSDLLHPSDPQIAMHDPNAPDEPVNDLGSQVYPHGFYKILTTATQRYRKPIYVLENGTADRNDNDTARQQFLVEHVREVWLAINQGGADVRSYIHWSLFDNFEWVEGFDARFGLMAVDYEHDFKRTPRPSAKLYAQIAHANALPEALLREYMPK